MTHIDPDSDLRELFARMKEEDRSLAPAFHPPRVTRAARPTWVTVAMAAAAAAAVVITALKVGDYRRATEERAERASVEAAVRERARLEVERRIYAGTAWTSPTDFLLNTSTSQLLRAVPTFGPAQWINGDSTSIDTRYRS